MRIDTRVLVAVALCFATSLAIAQGRGRQNELRTLYGHVLSSQDKPVGKAVVYLKNTKTLVIKTYITEPDGSYRFSALSPNVDYEVYADYQGARTQTKTLSSFDSRKQADFTLKLRK
jgi:carboxypeptidase family protein